MASRGPRYELRVVLPVSLIAAVAAWLAFEVLRSGRLAPLWSPPALLAVILAIALWWLLRRRVIDRVALLAAAARRLAEGAEVVSTGVTGSDELAALGATLDRMGQELAAWRARMAASEQRIRRVFDTMSEGIFGLDHAGRCSFANQAAADLLGFADPDELLSRDVHDLLRATRADGHELSVDELGVAGDATPRIHHDLFVNRVDGRPIPVELRTNPVAGGPLSGRVLSFLDVSERFAMQARLVLADRMAALGTLAAGIGHEINNPLTYAMAGVEMATASDSDPAEVREALADAWEGLARVRDIVRDLKLLSHSKSDSVGPIDLHETIEGATRIAGNVVRHRAELVRALEPVPRVTGNATKLSQVFINLLINASQAFPEKSAVRRITIATTTTEAGRASIEVRDTGQGIAPEVLGRIFDPFFTTKKVGEGSGLGLAISHSIIASMGGEIRVASQVGVGTCFTIELPAASVSWPAAVMVPAATIGATPRGRILVIDDDPEVGRVLCRLLKQDHDTSYAGSAMAALDQIRAGAPPDLLVCDLMMPEMSGIELFEALGEVAPALADRIVFISGGVFTAAAAAFVARHAGDVLDKPIDRAALAALVARKLAGGGQRDGQPREPRPVVALERAGEDRRVLGGGRQAPGALAG